MINKLITLILLSLISVSASAMPGLPGMSEKSSEPEASEESAQSAADSQEALVGQFKETLSSVILAQRYLALAFDQADEAEELAIVIEGLQGECGTKCMKRSVKVSEAANKSIGKLLKSETVITSEGKTNYLLALPPYIKGTLSAKDLLTEAKSWGKQATGEIKSAGMMNAPKIKKKLDAGMYVVQQTPKLIKNWATATKKIVTYAKASNIDLSSVKGANTDIFSD